MSAPLRIQISHRRAQKVTGRSIDNNSLTKSPVPDTFQSSIYYWFSNIARSFVNYGQLLPVWIHLLLFASLEAGNWWIPWLFWYGQRVVQPYISVYHRSPCRTLSPAFGAFDVALSHRDDAICFVQFCSWYKCRKTDRRGNFLPGRFSEALSLYAVGGERKKAVHSTVPQFP